MNMKRASYMIAAGTVVGVCFHSLFPAWYHKKRNPSVLRNTGMERTVMLTFDDGPDPRYTGKLLDLLKKEDVKAVFFTVTREAANNKTLIARMTEEGHIVGFHSTDHQNAMLRGWLYTRKDFHEGVRFLRSMGITSIYYRPPWGLSNLFTWFYMKQYHMHMILWDVMAEDWEKKATVSSIAGRCLSRIRDGSIICLHDGGERSGGAKGAPEKTIQALCTIIPELKKRGYRFVLPAECDAENRRRGVLSYGKQKANSQ